MSRSRHTIGRYSFGCLIAISAVAVAACQAPPATPSAAASTAAPAKPATITAPASTPASTAVAPAATATSAAAGPVSSTADVFKIGLSAPLSGPAVRAGNAQSGFAKLAVDDVNARGGVTVGGKTYRLELIIVDDMNTPDGGRAAANRLVLSDKVKVLLEAGGGPTGAAQPVTEPNGVIIMGEAMADASLGPNHPLTFLTYTHAAMRVGALYNQLVKDHPEVKSIIYVSTDDVTGHTTGDYSEAKAKSLGLTIVGREYYPADIKDVSPLATRVMRQAADAIDFGAAAGRGPVLVGLMKAFQEQKLKRVAFAASADVSALTDAASAMEGFSTAALADWKNSPISSTEKDVIQRFSEKVGEEKFEAYAMPQYQAVMILTQALSKAGTVEDMNKVAQTMREGTWDGVWPKTRFVGAKTFGLASALEQPVYLTGVRNGKVVTVGTQTGTLP